MPKTRTSSPSAACVIASANTAIVSRSSGSTNGKTLEIQADLRVGSAKQAGLKLRTGDGERR